MMPEGPGDPPEWMIKARDAIFSLLGYKPEQNTNQEQSTPVNRSARDEKIVELGSKVEDVKNVGKAMVPASKILAEKTGDALEATGNVVTATGYFAAPFTEGASLALVPVGNGIGLTGTAIKFGLNVVDGNYKDAVFTAGKEALFGKFDNVIEGAKGAGKIVKTDAAILGFFNEAWKDVAGFAYDTSKEKKK
ncbi:hypothetical protein [Pedobacter sp. MW01-1-1]|uniref:hypothetical protein n=1 Tax=Pedobacter sp. MW01-1-1 TaxID=3383027 RepID=UPI003FED71F9